MKSETTTARGPAYKSFTLSNYESLPQVRALPEALRWDIRVVGSVLPFKTNNYVVDELIDWDKVPDDPIFILTFPQKDMLLPEHFERMSRLLKSGAAPAEVKKAADEIRLTLNPHPAGQMEHNVPVLDGVRLDGSQHKYRETILFFPQQGQTCHAYCTFCFRWAQFVGMQDLKFAMKEGEQLRAYVEGRKSITDVLFTGGDPLIMKTRFLRAYIEPLLKIEHLSTIRLGSKALGYWPYRFLTDDDAGELLELFRDVVKAKKHLAFMAHFNHPVELSTPAVKDAIRLIRETGTVIRTQSPLVRRINDDAKTWRVMWRKQVRQGCIPYYMFMARDTGAQPYFEVPLVQAWEIYRDAVSRISGLARTVRGPSMSATPGKVAIDGVAEVKGEKVMVMRFLQARKTAWVGRPFFAKYDPKAVWLDQLKPAFGEKAFFYQKELDEIFRLKSNPRELDVEDLERAEWLA